MCGIRLTLLSFLFACPLSLASGQTATPARPEVLERLVKARELIRTAELETTVFNYKQAELDHRPVVARFETRLIAQDHHVVIDRGDADGVTARTPAGAPHPLIGGIPRLKYSAPGMRMERSDDLFFPTIMERFDRIGVEDFRSLGVGTGFPNRDIHATVWQSSERNPSVPQYEVSTENDLEVVRVAKESGTVFVTYWLDRSRDSNPVRVRHSLPDGEWTEVRNELAQVDGVWFPQKVSYFSSRFHGGELPERLVEITGATFNAPEHAQELSPASIGLEPGMVVFSKSGEGKTTDGRWTGSEVISTNEYLERLQRGEVKDGPRLTEALQRSISGEAQADRRSSPTVKVSANAAGNQTVGTSRGTATSQPSRDRRWAAWETFVEQFSEKYQLDAEQRQKAAMLLSRCEVKGDSFLASKASAIEKLETERAHSSNIAEIDEKLTKLLAPISRIFENDLKPGLEKLPTRAQRNAAAGRESSQEK